MQISLSFSSIPFYNQDMANQTLIHDRRNRILEYITKNPKTDVVLLSRVFNASETMIRRDLIALEKAKLIIRTHGGAILVEQKRAVWQTSALNDRLEKNKEFKQRIAAFTAGLVKDNESVIIDGGSTTQTLAPLIKDRQNMLFVTNSPDIADILLANETNNIIQIGGELRRDTHQTLGPDAEEHLGKYYVDKCIIGVSGVDPDIGCYTALPSEASFKKKAIAHAREKILIIDHMKFGRKAFSLAFGLNEIDILVTDSETPKEVVEKLRNRNITVFVV